MDSPEWLGPACDRLREVGLDAAAEALATDHVVRDRLERIVRALEKRIAAALRTGLRELDLITNADLQFIAEHRGEPAGETITRLRQEWSPFLLGDIDEVDVTA